MPETKNARTRKKPDTPAKGVRGRARAENGRRPSDAAPSRRSGGAVAGNGNRDLVIVESPAKARTLAGILGPGYEITASVGHVRDLPPKRLGVDVDKDFEPTYEVPREKRDVVERIRKAATTANTVYLA